MYLLSCFWQTFSFKCILLYFLNRYYCRVCLCVLTNRIDEIKNQKTKHMHATRSQGSGSHLNGAGHRRPQTLMSPGGVDRKFVAPTDLTLTIIKDCNGYGMKVL